MRIKHQYMVLLYWIILLVDAYFAFNEQTGNRFYTKTLLMPLLAVFYVSNVTLKHHLASKVLTLTALALAWAGDIVLLNNDSSGFIIGLILFLLMHIGYIVYFVRVHRIFPVRDPAVVWLPFLIIAIYDAILMSQLLKDAEARKLEIPLVVYMLIISIMFVAAYNISGSRRAKTLANRFFIPGAVLFVVSDSLLGLNKYIFEQESIVSSLVILTYGFAQLLIVQGFIKHVKVKRS